MLHQVCGMSRIAVLTYSQKHRKTYDTLCLLKAKGYEDVTVYAQPMTYKKKRYPLVAHRPELIMNVPEPAELCRSFSYCYMEGQFEDIIAREPDRTLFLLCGAGLLPQSFVSAHRIINAHPGYVPFARGLDAYKWAVYYNLPIGVTTHFIGDYVDAGEIIERRLIDVELYDTFHSVAQRIYENEIDMLVGAVELADCRHETVIPDNEPFRRMPEEKERELLVRFENCRKGKLGQ